jgi:COMM domain containing 2
MCNYLARECTKHVVKETSLLPHILDQVGMREVIVPVFSKCFADNKRRLHALKGPLGLDTWSYHSLAWRLEVEVAKRSLHVTTQPSFQIRLDLVNNATTVNTKRFQSHNLQCDFANLKMLQSELQRAVDEHTGVHSQRISRYIS